MPSIEKTEDPQIHFQNYNNFLTRLKFARRNAVAFQKPPATVNGSVLRFCPSEGCFAIQHPLEEAASPSDREIDANQKHGMSDHDKNLFIEQLYAILRGGVKEPLAVEPTQDEAIEKARNWSPMLPCNESYKGEITYCIELVGV
jgi:hypothetical protein